MTPNTDCPECWRAEATMLQRAMRSLGELCSPPPTMTQIVIQHGRAMATILSAAAGQRVTWYDRHRAAFIATGDRAELDRMARHVR